MAGFKSLGGKGRRHSDVLGIPLDLLYGLKGFLKRGGLLNFFVPSELCHNKLLSNSLSGRRGYGFKELFGQTSVSRGRESLFGGNSIPEVREPGCDGGSFAPGEIFSPGVLLEFRFLNFERRKI